MELRYEAALEADKLVKGADPKTLKSTREQIYRDLSAKKIAPNGKILNDELVSTVEAIAFQKELTGRFGRWGDSLREMPGGRLAVPFYGTGVNIAEYGAQISPIGMFLPEFKRVMKSGTESQKAIMRGRLALGYGLTATAAGLASTGLMTGYGPPPGPDRERWLQDHEPMSFKVGDKWVSYQTIPGFSMVLAVTADMVYSAGKLSDGDAKYVINAIPWTLASTMGTMPMFQGVLDYAALLDFEKYSVDSVTKAIANFGNQMLGGGGARRNLEFLLSDGMYKYREWAEGFIEGHSILGTVSGGIFGEKVPVINPLTGEQFDTKYSNKWNLLNPFTVVGKEENPLIDVLDNYGFDVRLSVPTELGGIKLTPDEQALFATALYDNGNFPDALTQVLKSSAFEREYQAWRKDYENGTAVPKEESAWYKRLRRVQDIYVAKARRELKFGDSEVSEHWRNTYPDRSRAVGTGNAGNFTPEQTSTLRELLEFTSPAPQ